jgi:hypothetical protein
MPSKFAVITAAGRFVRTLALWLQPPPADPSHPSGFELPYWAYRKADGEAAPRWHDLRETWAADEDE